MVALYGDVSGVVSGYASGVTLSNSYVSKCVILNFTVPGKNANSSLPAGLDPLDVGWRRAARLYAFYTSRHA